MPVVIIVVILYWFLVRYDPDIDRGFSYFDTFNLHTHLFSGIVSLLEIWIIAIPIRLLSMVYPVSFGAGYIVFSGIYLAANGTNTNDSPYIYSFLDFGNEPATAVRMAFATVFVVLPLTHSVCHALYLMREGVLYLVGVYCCKKDWRWDNADVEMQNSVKTIS